MGLQDFAGGTVVHITAAVAALVAALVMRPRRGFGTVAILPHKLTLTVTGAGMLWVGWVGFNAGSVGPAAAVAIGLMAGVVCFHATNFLKQKLRVDQDEETGGFDLILHDERGYDW